MRKSDREILGIENLYKIALNGDSILLAFNNGDYPYLLPVNYGCDLKGDTLYFYFHGALDGTKYNFLKDGAKVSFEIDCNHELIVKNELGYCSMKYESLIGKGIIKELKEYNHIYSALDLLVKHYHKDDDFIFNPAAINRTRTFEIKVIEVTGKSKN